MNLLKIIKEDIEELKLSKVFNPLYGKNVFFFDKCAGPKHARNQLLGYLGVFCAYTELSRDIDYCIIPYRTTQSIINSKEDEIIDLLLNKLESKEKENGNTTNTIPNTSLIPEEVLFTYIQDNLLGDDSVKIKQFKRINFQFNLSDHENAIRYSGYNI